MLLDHAFFSLIFSSKVFNKCSVDNATCNQNKPHSLYESLWIKEQQQQNYRWLA